MPFTATHVAAVLPFAWLCRWRLPLSALAIGSMIPDVSGFFPAIVDYRSTHTIRGVITHCVPLGVIGYYFFHMFVKEPIVDLLPDCLRRRLRPWSHAGLDVGLVRMLVVTLCVAVGALTHVVWDSFTHGGGWGVQQFPSLQRQVATVEGQPVYVFSLLQHGSSVLLLPPLVLGFLWWIFRQPAIDSCSDEVSGHSSTQTLQPRFTMPAVVSWMFVLMMTVGAWIYFNALQTHGVEVFWIGALRATVKHFGAMALVGVILYGPAMHAIWWFELRNDRQPQA